MSGVVSWVSTWLIMIFLLVILAKTGPGKTIVYYFLWLAIVLLVVSHADEISQAINVKAFQLNG